MGEVKDTNYTQASVVNGIRTETCPTHKIADPGHSCAEIETWKERSAQSDKPIGALTPPTAAVPTPEGGQGVDKK